MKTFTPVYSATQIMAPQFPSIQSLFEKEALSKEDKTHGTGSQIDTSGGYSKEELEAALYPTLHTWKSRNEYEQSDISSLVPGPARKALQGRVVNFYQQLTLSKKPQAAKGCLKVLIKDDTGILMVRPYVSRLWKIRSTSSDC